MYRMQGVVSNSGPQTHLISNDMLQKDKSDVSGGPRLHARQHMINELPWKHEHLKRR